MVRLKSPPGIRGGGDLAAMRLPVLVGLVLGMSAGGYALARRVLTSRGRCNRRRAQIRLPPSESDDSLGG